jgi:response regulator RpfG family c-di-GMP phosphodiesterase
VSDFHALTPTFVVLIVDDQPIIIEGVRRLLSVLPQARVESCTRASDALARALQLVPAVILQDIHMPDGDGLELLSRYRAESALAGTSIVILSGEEDPLTKAQAFAQGADDYLVKLPPALEFVARVRHHAEAAGAKSARDHAFHELQTAQRELARRNALLDQANERLAASNDALVIDADAQREIFDSLTALGKELARVQDLDILLSHILRESAALAESSYGAVFLVEGETLRAAEIFGDAKDTVRVIPLDARSVVGESVLSGRVVRRKKCEQCALALGTEGIFGSNGSSALFVPITRTGDRVLGCIALIEGKSGDESDGSGFDESDERLVAHFASLASVAIERAMLVRSMIMRMISMAELRDPTETAGHVGRVADLSVMLYGYWCALRPTSHSSSASTRESMRAVDILRIGALLHDVGKVGISDAILKKPGKLDEEEFVQMKRHAQIGADLFAGLRTDFDECAAQVALCHHEKWNGSGYPRQLVGEAIPLFARIVAVADVFDALSSKRAYKEAWTREQISALFRRESGQHFDPELASIFLEHQVEAERIRARRPE